MQLNDIQEQFKDLMLDNPKALDKPPEGLASVFDEGDIPLSTRLKVYRNNIIGSLTDVILASFPACEKLVGKEFLEGMARSFVLENPPSAGCLNTFGRGFAEFIETFEPAKSLPYLPDVARLEIALNDSYYAPDDTPLNPENLAAIAPEDLGKAILKLRSSVFLVHSSFPVQQIHEFCIADDPNAAAPNMDEGPAYLMIYRPKLESLTVILDEASFHFLSLLGEEKPLGVVLQETLSTFEHFNIQNFLNKHLELETFSGVSANT